MIVTATALRFRPSVYVLMLLAILMGGDAYRSLPLEAAPDIQIPLILVSTLYPGVAPADIEKLLTTPLERELKDLKDVKEMASTSSESISLISIEFESGVDMDQAYQRVRDKVDKASSDLPKDAEESNLLEINISEFPILLINISGPQSLMRLKEIAEGIEDRIETIPGVLEVELTGGREREIHIDLDPRRMAYYKLGMGQVIASIQQEHLDIPGGKLKLADSESLLRMSGEYEDVQRMSEIVLKAPQGFPVKLADVGRVRDDFKERESISRINGEECVTLRVQKRSGENIVRISDEVKALMREVESSYKGEIKISIQQDESKEIRNIVRDLENSVITGLILVLAVLFFWMGLRNAFFVAIAIPLSLLITFAALSLMGITLNMVVLFSLIIALGMLVDNSIVVVESIFRHASEGSSRSRAAYEGTKEVAWPIIASTATTIAAFGPMLFWPDLMGEFMSFLPKTVIIALLASLFVALVINPVIAASFLRGGDALFDASGEARSLILKLYQGSLRLSLRVPLLILLLGGASLALIVYTYGELGAGVEFFPITTPEKAQIRIKAPLGTRLGKTDILSQKVEAITTQDDNTKNTVANVGFSGDIFGGGSSKTHSGVLDLEFKDRHERSHSTWDTIKQMRQQLLELTGAEYRMETQKMGPPTGAPIDVRISGEDYEILRQEAEKIKALIKEISGVVDIKDDFDAGLPELKIRVDREKAKRRKIGTALVGNAIRTAFNGSKAGVLREGDKEHEIIVRFDPRFRGSVEDLLDIYVSGKDDLQVPLRDVTQLEAVGGVGSVRHIDRKRSLSITADVLERSSSEVLAEVQEVLGTRYKRPNGYSLRFGGESEEQDKAAAFLSRAFLIGVFIMALILITQFNSLLKPLIILASVLMSMMGVLGGLLITGNKFSIIMTGMGLISLAGVVVNNAIVLMDYIDQLRDQGEALLKAIIQAGLVRFRPVMMTAITTILGMLPMALGINIDFRNLSFDSGGGSTEWWGPMAQAIIFGLLFATIMTLVMVPVMYLLQVQLSTWVDKLLRREAP